MAFLFYRVARLACLSVRYQCVREVVVGRERVAGDGPMLLAVTHLSHLEPVVVGCHLGRPIAWVARVEFYRRWWARWTLGAIGAIPVDRQGVPVSTVRAALRRLAEGGVVGIFPEGAVTTGAEAVFRGGICKGGACVIAQRAGVPIVPVVVLGTEKLNAVGPWLPFRRARVFVAYGQPVPPEAPGGSPRARRRRFTNRLQAEFVATYRALLEAANLRDQDVP